MSCCQSDNDSLRLDCNGCFICDECPKVKGRFGLAWVSESPECPCPEPVGWQVEFFDSPSKVEQKCQEMVRWINCPPLPRCDPCPPDELCSPCNPPRCNPCAPKCNPCIPKCPYQRNNQQCCCNQSPARKSKKCCCCKQQTKRVCYPPSSGPCCRSGRSPRRRSPNKCCCKKDQEMVKCGCDDVPVKDTNNDCQSGSGSYKHYNGQNALNMNYVPQQVTRTNSDEECNCSNISENTLTLFKNHNTYYTDTEYYDSCNDDWDCGETHNVCNCATVSGLSSGDEMKKKHQCCRAYDEEPKMVCCMSCSTAVNTLKKQLQQSRNCYCHGQQDHNGAKNYDPEYFSNCNDKCIKFQTYKQELDGSVYRTAPNNSSAYNGSIRCHMDQTGRTPMTHPSSIDMHPETPMRQPLQQGGTPMQYGVSPGAQMQPGTSMQDMTMQQGGTPMQQGGTPMQQGGTPMQQGGTPMQQGTTSMLHGTPMRSPMPGGMQMGGMQMQPGTPMRQPGTPGMQYGGTPMQQTGATPMQQQGMQQQGGTPMYQGVTPMQQRSGTPIRQMGYDENMYTTPRTPQTVQRANQPQSGSSGSRIASHPSEMQSNLSDTTATAKINQTPQRPPTPGTRPQTPQQNTSSKRAVPMVTSIESLPNMTQSQEATHADTQRNIRTPQTPNTPSRQFTPQSKQPTDIKPLRSSLANIQTPSDHKPLSRETSQEFASSPPSKPMIADSMNRLNMQSNRSKDLGRDHDLTRNKSGIEETVYHDAHNTTFLVEKSDLGDTTYHDTYEKTDPHNKTAVEDTIYHDALENDTTMHNIMMMHNVQNNPMIGANVSKQVSSPTTKRRWFAPGWMRCFKAKDKKHVYDDITD